MTDVCLHQGKFNSSVNSEKIDFIFLLTAVYNGMWQTVEGAPAPWIQSFWVQRVFPARWGSSRAQTNKCEHQTTENKQMNIVMDVTNDRSRKNHGGCRHSVTTSTCVEVGSASLQTLIFQQHICFYYTWVIDITVPSGLQIQQATAVDHMVAMAASGLLWKRDLWMCLLKEHKGVSLYINITINAYIITDRCFLYPLFFLLY